MHNGLCCSCSFLIVFEIVALLQLFTSLIQHSVNLPITRPEVMYLLYLDVVLLCLLYSYIVHCYFLVTCTSLLSLYDGSYRRSYLVNILCVILYANHRYLQHISLCNVLLTQQKVIKVINLTISTTHPHLTMITAL